MAEISVIVPVYKAEAYLPACVDSILAQTFSDLEVYLVDDGSPDGCGVLCDAYAKQDPRVRVIHQENQGQAAARNHALEQVSAPWVCFVDSDDAIHPQMLELLHQAAEASGASISMCEMVESPQLPEDFLRQRDGGYALLTIDQKTMVQLFDAGQYPSWVVCGKLIRREIAQWYPFHPGRVYEDNEAACRWVWKAGTLARIPEALYYYRTNPISTTQQEFSLKKQDYLWALESILRFYHSLGWEDLAVRFCQLYAQEFAGQYFRIRRNMDRPDVLKKMRACAGKLIREGIPFTKSQKETLLDAIHPKLIRYYWPVEGLVRTVREKGITGLIRKIQEKL